MSAAILPRFADSAAIRHNSGVRASTLKELGLLPVWRRRAPAGKRARAPVAAPAARASSPPAASAPAASAAPAPAAGADVSRMDWLPLRRAVEECRLCALCEKRRKPAFGAGDQKARVMFIGEGPGSEEDRQGIPFVGPAGKLLDQMLAAIDLSRKEGVYIANIVKCRPPDNRNPTAAEAQSCLPYLRRQIALAQPRLLVALGRVASTHLLQSETAIGGLRQKMHDYGGIPLVVTYHPAYLLRSPLEKRKAWEDLCFINKLIRKDN